MGEKHNIMRPFLEDIARYVYDTFRDRLPEVCLVFPNRRAGLFFDHYLAGIIDRPVLKPAVTTISDLMKNLSGLRYADDLELVFDLYRTYIQKTKSKETFDEFYQWGEILLADFDDVDKYLVKAEDLFSNLSSLKEMDRKFDYLTPEQVKVIQKFWKSFNPGNQSSHQEKFISVWEVLHPVYAALKEVLLGKGAGYEGLVYRAVAERIKAGNPPEMSRKTTILAGFNALSTCEEVLFSHLKKSGAGIFLWDYDEHYLGDSMQEAGHFLTRYLKEYPPPQVSTSFRNLQGSKQEKDICIYSVPSDVGQAGLVHDILQQLPEVPTDAIHDTAVVLADEHLLIPVLYALPESTGSVNVTMGYPVSQTPVNSIIELLFRLYRNARINRTGVNYYHKDILALVSHQMVHYLFAEDNRQVRKMIQDGSLIFIPVGKLHLNELLKMLFPADGVPSSAGRQMASCLMSVLEKISVLAKQQEVLSGKSDLEFISHIYLRLKRLTDLLKGYEGNMSIDTFSRLYRKSIGNSRVPFVGEPLSGIQVMGVLETRLLDFRNIILLSMNEGCFPKTQISPSFIPPYLRHAFGMPTPEHRDAIYAYYFYRLLQRAINVHLLYNSSTGGTQKGERSRYIYQLQYDDLFKTRQETPGMDVRPGHPPPLVVNRNSRIQEKLAACYTGEEGAYLSAGALNAYLECSLSFFFKYILRLKEPEQAEEEIDSLAFGNILHDTIAGLYSSLESEVINAGDLEKLLKDESMILEKIDESFKENFPAREQAEDMPVAGTNILAREVLSEYICNIIREDMKHAPIKLLEQEGEHIITIPVRTGGGMKNVRIGGRLDRVDSTAGIIRILDFKTGSPDLAFTDTGQLFVRNDSGRNKAAFQVLLYCRLYASANKSMEGRLVPGLYFARQMHGESYDYHLQKGEKGKRKSSLQYFRDISSEFEAGLAGLLEQIFNPDLPFTQTPDEKSCRYCPYTDICYRNRKED